MCTYVGCEKLVNAIIDRMRKTGCRNKGERESEKVYECERVYHRHGKEEKN